MSEKETKDNFSNSFSGDWIKTASKLWDDTLKFQSEGITGMSSFMDFFNSTSSEPQLNRLFKTDNSVNNLILSFFYNPEHLKGFPATSEVLPVLIMNMSKNLAASFSEIQNIVAEKSSRIGSDFKELNIDDFNTGIFTIWKELYKTDFQKLYNVPQLGLTRNYQEQINATMDRGNQFFMAFSELMNLLYIPVKKANKMTLEKYQELVENKEISDDPKTIYKIWIKSLEGYYMQMLQSPEYSKVLNSVIDTHSGYKESKGKILEAFLHQLQIPTNKEMDELYKETYLLKKRLRSIEKKLTLAEKAASVNAKVKNQTP